MTVNTVTPWKLGTLTRALNPLIFELCHPIGKKIGVFSRSLKS